MSGLPVIIDFDAMTDEDIMYFIMLFNDELLNREKGVLKKQ